MSSLEKRKKFEFMSTLRWRKGRNLSLCNHWTGEKKEVQVYVVNGGKEEIRVYLVIELEKRKEFSKFKFRSSLNWRKGRNSSLYRHWRKGKNFRNSSLYHHRAIIEKKEISEIRFYVIKKFLKFPFISSGFSFCWRKGRNFRNSILCHQKIFEIPKVLSRHYAGKKERKKFSKFDFTSSRNSNLSHHWVIAGNFQNSILCRQEIFEIQIYLIIEL